MIDYPHVPAAFINAIRADGTKEEACDWLQKLWNETCALRRGNEVSYLAGFARCKELAARKTLDTDVYGSCEMLGPEDRETGQRECSLDVKGGDCLCSVQLEALDEAATAIRALVPPWDRT